MTDDIAISVENVSKIFRLPHERYSSLKQNAMHIFTKQTYTQFDAVKDVSFEVKRGEFFGIVGRNGSGKSTLLKMLAGIYVPTEGSIKINGSLSPFIELGVGFNPELTARDNVFLNGAILGLTRKEIESRFDEIMHFAELEEFVDQKLKNFSSGMQVRLAFSIAIQAQSEILLIDEVLAVGDVNFQEKCFNVFKQLKKEGKTIVFVSHDMDSVKSFCDRAILISGGSVTLEGKTDHIINAYNELNYDATDTALSEKNQDGGSNRWGSGEITIESINTTSRGSKKSVYPLGQQIEINLTIEAHSRIESPIIGVVVRASDGTKVFVTNTRSKKVKTPNLAEHDKLKVQIQFDNMLNHGAYTISPAIADKTGRLFYDWIEDAHSFQIVGESESDAVVLLDHTFSINKEA